jgi:hypothetical protein
MLTVVDYDDVAVLGGFDALTDGPTSRVTALSL